MLVGDEKDSFRNEWFGGNPAYHKELKDESEQLEFVKRAISEDWQKENSPKTNLPDAQDYYEDIYRVTWRTWNERRSATAPKLDGDPYEIQAVNGETKDRPADFKTEAMWWGRDGAGHAVGKDSSSPEKKFWVRLVEQYRKEMAEARSKYHSISNSGESGPGKYSGDGDVWVAKTTAPKLKPPGIRQVHEALDIGVFGFHRQSAEWEDGLLRGVRIMDGFNSLDSKAGSHCQGTSQMCAAASTSFNDQNAQMKVRQSLAITPSSPASNYELHVDREMGYLGFQSRLAVRNALDREYEKLVRIDRSKNVKDDLIDVKLEYTMDQARALVNNDTEFDTLLQLYSGFRGS